MKIDLNLRKRAEAAIEEKVQLLANLNSSCHPSKYIGGFNVALKGKLIAEIRTDIDYMKSKRDQAIEDFKRIEAESLFEDIDLEQCVVAFMKCVMVFDPKCFKVEWCEE